jgi:hypothetical protein
MNSLTYTAVISAHQMTDGGRTGADWSRKFGNLRPNRFAMSRAKRLGIDNPSARYLAGYLAKNKKGDGPPISLERVMASADLIEQMGRERLKPLKEKEK